jgi:hypothetical protein
VSASVLLWILGVAVAIVGVAMIRGPLARSRELEATQANLARYDAWRGGRRPDGDERTGADEMRDQLRSRVRLATVVIAVGVGLIVAGFFVR